MGQALQKSNVREARKGLYQNLLIHAGEQIFATAGYNAAKVQDIAAQAGLSLGTFYGVFAGKDDLYNAIHDTRGQELAELAANAVDPKRSPVENLLLGIASYLGYFFDHQDYLRMHLNEGTAWALEAGLETPAQMTVWRDGLALMAGVLRDAVAAGDVIQEDPEILAKIISATHQVKLAAWLDGEEPRQADELITNVLNLMALAFLTPQGRQKVPGVIQSLDLDS